VPRSRPDGPPEPGGPLDVVIAAAQSFLATHGRLLDRRRFERLRTGGSAAGVLAALDGYRNDDGGYGWGLEPDLRSPESQPACAMHALEVLAEVAPTTSTSAVELCDWLGVNSLPDGGLPLALPTANPAGCVRFWLDPDVETSSLQMTAQVAANALLVARHDPVVRGHPWLAGATAWCLEAIRSRETQPSAHELLFALRFLDAAADTEPEAVELFDRLRRFLPEDGVIPVEGGAEGEAIRPLDLAPRPEGAARRLFSDEVISGEVERLAAHQQPDGGWFVDFASASPAAALEWRGYATVNAIRHLLQTQPGFLAGSAR
jgi:hypothetical protein